MNTPLGLLFLLSQKDSVEEQSKQSDNSLRERAVACELIDAHNREMQLRQRIRELEDQIEVWEKVAVQFTRSKQDSRILDMLAETQALLQNIRDERRASRPVASVEHPPLIGLPARELVTVREVSEAFKVSKRTVFNWIAQGRVKIAPTPGATRLIVRESLMKAS